MALEVLLVEDSKTQAAQIKETLESVGLRVRVAYDGPDGLREAIANPPALETKTYSFTANAGDPFFFDAINRTGGSLNWRLIDPYGLQLWSNSFTSVGTQALPSSGCGGKGKGLDRMAGAGL